MTPEIRAFAGLHALYWRMQGVVERANIDPPLSRMERHVIGILEHPRPLNVIAQQVEALPSTLSAVSAALEQKGLVTRRRDPADGRVWLLELTDAGRDVRSCLEVLFSELFREETGMPPEEIETLAALLSRFSRLPLEGEDAGNSRTGGSNDEQE